MEGDTITMGGHQQYVLAGGKVHTPDCTPAPDGDGGFVDSVERAEELGVEPCSCLAPEPVHDKPAKRRR